MKTASNINRQILHLAVPNIISNLTVPLLSSVDTALVGHLPDIRYIGAVALGSMIFNFIYWGFGFLRMGTTGLTAQAFGAENNRAVIHTLLRALIVAAAIGLLLILLQVPIAKISFLLVHGSSEVEHHARIYFNIRIFAAPATLALYAFHGWFLGMQNARYPLLLSVIVNAANIGFNVLFVLGMGMNSNGVALGTVLAQYLGLALAVFLMMRKYRDLMVYIRRALLFELNEVKRFFTLNFDIFIRTLCLIFVFSFFTAKSAEFGDDILAANTILMQLWMIFAYGIDGFAFSAESLVGKFMGAGDKFRLKRAILFLFAWGSGSGLLFSLVFHIFDAGLIQIFTNNPQLVTLTLGYMGWTVAAPFINSFCYIWDGIYIGATASRAMRNAMLASTLVIYLPVYYFARGLWGNHGMWLAMLVFMAARAVTLSALARKHIYQT